ncbi:L,D-transpeptidase family protein [Streptomyces sp. NPDC021622]|uniref:L,D-transpeptidase family protein n=1 Tax=Streptomyces sp. NPDC021622 TaxID=3155013 RepID=UPI0033C70A76
MPSSSRRPHAAAYPTAYAAAGAALTLLLTLPLTACGTGAQADGSQSGEAVTVSEAPRTSRATPERPREIPALGPKTRSRIPRSSTQALVVTGEAPDANRATAVLYMRKSPSDAAGWRPVSDPWPAHNGLRGWTSRHVQGDRKSPVGVYGLTDAGGLLPDPGTRFPYDQGPAFTARGTGFKGEPLTGSFDYVIAINYNREPGRTPLDWTRPLGAGRGGGIWLHVDHGGPTQGCVSLPKARMKELLRSLDPARKPVVVMGDAGALGA